MIIQFVDHVVNDSHGNMPTDQRLNRAVQREIQEQMLTCDNGTEGFEEYLDTGEDQMPDHVSIIDENEFFLRYENEF